MILAYISNIPFIGLSWQKKVISFFEIIGDEKSVFSLFEIKKKLNDILKIFYQKYKDIAFEREKITVKLHEIKKLFSINEFILENILDVSIQSN
jgi:hypothetical protein